MHVNTAVSHPLDPVELIGTQVLLAILFDARATNKRKLIRPVQHLYQDILPVCPIRIERVKSVPFVPRLSVANWIHKLCYYFDYISVMINYFS